MALAKDPNDQKAVDLLSQQLASGKIANDPSGMPMTSVQLAGVKDQLAQLTGAKTQEQAIDEGNQRVGELLKSSQTINNYAAETPQDIEAQQQMNQQYGLQPSTGFIGQSPTTPGVYVDSTPSQRTKQLMPVTPLPTPTNPMIPISASGANPPPPPPITYSDYTSMATTYKPPTLEQYNAMSPEELISEQTKAAAASGDMQKTAINSQFDETGKQLDLQQQQEQARLDAARTTGTAANAAALEKYKADQSAQLDVATQNINRSAQQRQEQADMSLAFSGFSRSTKAADIRDNIRRDTTAQIADINRQSARAVTEYEASLLNKMNNDLEKYQSRVDKYGDAKSQLALDKVKAQSDLTMQLFKANPLNPENIFDTFDKITKIKIDQSKASSEERKALFSRAKDLLDMSAKYGISPTDLSEEDQLALSNNLGVPLSALPQTLTRISKKSAIDDFFAFNKQLAAKGIPIDNQTSSNYLKQLQESNDPDSVLNEYFALQSKNSGFNKKGGKKSSSGSSSTASFFSAPSNTPTTQTNELPPQLQNSYGFGQPKAQGGDIATDESMSIADRYREITLDGSVSGLKKALGGLSPEQQIAKLKLLEAKAKKANQVVEGINTADEDMSVL